MNRRSKTARLLTGGLVGASTAPLPGDEHWDDVVLLLDGTDPATDLSTQQQTVTETGSSTGFSNETDPFGSTQDVFDFNRAEASGSGYQVSSSPITFGSSPFAIEMWIKLDSASLTSTQLLYSERSAGTTCVTFRVEGQKLTFFKDNSGGGKFSAATNLAADTWYHVALTYDGSTVRLFLDGQLDGSSNQSLTFNPNVAPVLGYDRAFPETTYQLDGQMAQVRVTKGVARYTANFTPQKFLPFAARPNSGTFGLGDEHWGDVSLLIRGDTLTDLSGNETPTANNGAAAGDTSPVKFASGSMSFDGTNDYINAGSTDLLDVAGGDWTIEAWVYLPDLSPSYQMIASSGGSVLSFTASGGIAWQFYIRTTTLHFAYNTASSNASLSGTHGMSENTWHHVAASRNGSTFRLFVDGSQVASATGTPSAPSGTDRAVIGIGNNTVNDPYKGNIEDFRITKGVARYTAAFTPPAASLPTNAPVVGRRGVGSVTAYAIGHSLDLDGSNDYLSRSFGSNGSSSWTVSMWFKMDGAPATVGDTTVFDNSVTASNRSEVQILSDGSVQYLTNTTGTAYRKQSVAGVVSANTWHHVVVSQTSTDATVYFDGAEISTFGTMQSNATITAALSRINKTNGSHTVGRRTWASTFFDGKVADVHFIDGQALTASNFGETASGTWYPKAYSGTYGTNGFHLDFADNSTTAALGNDVSGNGNDFTVNNMATGDQTTDVPAAAPAPPLRTRGYLGAAPAAGGMLTLYDRYVEPITPAGWNGSGAEFLLVGGGGSGGGGSFAAPGGGGAGGMVVGANQTLSINTTYSIVIGSGGAGGGGAEADGADSTFSFNTLVADGGGRGGKFTNYQNVEVGKDGGSGGGGGCVFRTASPAGPRAGGTSTQNTYSGGITGYGFAGGTGNQYPSSGTYGYYAAGGGGAGAAGSNSAPSSGYAGDGGAGRQWAVDSQYYAGGGGGNALREGGPAISGGGGGIGGGGDGQRFDGTTTRSPTAGTANTGGGGGGYASGGSGVFKIWIPVANYTNYVVGAELTEAASQQVTYGGTAGTLITITASSGTSTNTITFN